MEVQLNGFQRMFTHRPKSQNLCDPESWEAGVIPSMWFPEPLNPRALSCHECGPRTSEATGT